jgi:uncharacterized protein (DUF58 family)
MSLESISGWLASRAPRRKQFILSRNNIYIFPSASGLIYLLMLLVMLLTAINYQNSLIYALTFFLGTLFFLSIWMCFLNLSGLRIERAETGRVFEGEPSEYFCRISKKKQLPPALKLGPDKVRARIIPYLQHETVDVAVITGPESRGRHKIPRIYLESRFPFGLIVAWTWLKPDLDVLVYPRAVQGYPESALNGEGDVSNRVSSTGDLNDIKEYRPGDPGNRILWKKYAASDALVVRHHEQSNYKPDWVSWDHYPSAATEDRLRFLCFDVCQLSDARRTFGLAIPGVRIEPDYGEIHRRKCLDALALFQQ